MEIWLLHAVGISLMYRALIGGVKRCFTTVSASLFPAKTCMNTYIQVSYDTEEVAASSFERF